MNRREFSALLPLLAAAPALSSAAPAGAQTAHAALQPLASGEYPGSAPKGPTSTGRTAQHYLQGMLPHDIRLEAHTTTLEPGAGPEPIGTHKHSEMWFVREGELGLMTKGVNRTLKPGEMGLCVAGDEHSVWNASKTERTSYFVVTVGPPE